MGQPQEADRRSSLEQPVDKWGLFTPVPTAPEYPEKEKYQEHLLEQYKLYVEMADRVSQRRLTTNSYFLSINSAILAFVGYITSKPAGDAGHYLWLVGGDLKSSSRSFVSFPKPLYTRGQVNRAGDILERRLLEG